MGLTREDFAEVSGLAGLVDKGANTDEALAKMGIMYEKIRKHEMEDDSKKTKEEVMMEEAKFLMDSTALGNGQWGSIRGRLADIYDELGKTDLANFVDPTRSSVLE